ncbi:MAG TPA: chemotaxis protein CheX [Bryobacteraceae bacterium]|nr:chemotaxis protein CheX [Bryobacteraceae bacterium]
MIQDELTISADLLEQTVGPIFETMMSMQVTQTNDPWMEDPDRVTASVQLAGGWNGVILLEVNSFQACYFAGRFMAMDPPEALDNDVRDVLGELANMIGGNLKSALVPDAHLSIPEVVDGVDVSLRMCGCTVALRQGFGCEAGVFWISLVQPRADRV